MAEHHGHDHDHDHGHAHGHGHGHGHGRSLKHTHLIGKAIWVTVFFMFIELAAGFYANSLALISDGVHMLTDVGALGLSFFALWVARRPSTPQMSFGYHRAEILGALASGLLIWLLAGVLIYEAIARLGKPPEVNGAVVLVVATIGLLANLLSMSFLHGARRENMNIRAAYLHLMADSLGSVGAVIAGAVLWMTGWRPIDPLITIFCAALMLWSSWALVREAVEILMESTPSHVDPERVAADLRGIGGVKETHDLHIWTVSSGRLALSVHLIAESDAVLARANALLKETYGIVHTTIQIEHPDRFRAEGCYDCEPEARQQGT
jgi:cobalt-zinc-cadmium efflux system protein